MQRFQTHGKYSQVVLHRMATMSMITRLLQALPLQIRPHPDTVTQLYGWSPSNWQRLDSVPEGRVMAEDTTEAHHTRKPLMIH